MRRIFAGALAVVAAAGSWTSLQAQERPTSPAARTADDPRVGLKAGLHDAGEAAWHMELVARLPRPEGFFDPAAPAGVPPPPEMLRDAADAPADAPADRPATPTAPAAPFTALDFANTDLAFSGTHLFVGNYHGFTVYDIANPRAPRLVSSVVCPGGQGDVSVHGHLLFMSVEQTRGRLDCGTGGVEAPVSDERFRGVRIFDISNIEAPAQVAAVQTCRGSHTHTLVTDPKDAAHVYVYGSGTSTARSAEELAGCSGADPGTDPDTALFSIDVIKVPLAAPQDARIVSRPRIFADEATGRIDGLWLGGDHGPGTQKTAVTNQCHDITVFPAIGLAAGACSGNGILLDISDPASPVRLDHVVDENFAYWHSATFNNDGTKVIFTDEWGGGVRARCQATDLPTWGANAIFEVVDRRLRFASYYKLPAPQTAQENCVAHNGSLVPVPGRDIKVQAWYQGGVSVFDFTDAAHPYEIAFFDRGPLDARQLIVGGFWSAYWYNGYVYGAEMARGLDVFTLTAGEHLSQDEIDAARLARMDAFNVQHQDRVSWPAHPTVARAYLAQLRRTGGIAPARAAAIDEALTRLDQASAPDTARAALRTLAGDLTADAGSARPPDASRLRALAANLEAQAAARR
jgi:hypothetical protein